MPDVFKNMPADMREHHGMYDNRLTAAYEAWLQGLPYEGILGAMATEGNSPAGPDGPPQSNVRMSNPSFNGNQNEFQIAINPADTRFAIGTSNDGRSAGVGIYRTSDGGLTWTAQDAPTGPGCCDPAVAYGSDGVVYVGVLAGNGQKTIRSTDNGATWEQLPLAQLPDRNNLAVDPRDSNIVYITYSDLNGMIGSNRIKGYRSTDGGHTWGNSFFIGAPAPPMGYEQSSQPRVASDGTLYVGYQQYINQGAGCSAGVQNVLAKSTDGGQTFTYTTMDIRQGGACVSFQAGRGIFCVDASGRNFRSRSHPIIGVNPTNPQIVYMVYSGGDLGSPYSCGGGTGFHSDILFRRSTDGGATFSDIIKINQDNGPTTDHYYPWMDVAPNGKIWVGWNDRRGDPQNFRSRWYQAFSTDQGATWTEKRIGDVDVQPSDFIGDYHGLAAKNNRVLGMWYDSRNNLSGDPYTDPHSGMAVAQTSPGNNEVITQLATEFVVHFSDPYDPKTVLPTALTVNNIPATSVEMTTPDTLTFTYQVSPITQQGLQTMAMEKGAVTRLEDGDPLQAFSSNFRYAEVRLAVDSSTPAEGSTVEIPFTTLQLHFNVPIDPATIRPSNLTVSQGRVTGARALDKQTAEYTLGDVTFVDNFRVNMAAGAVTDVFGNPGLAYTGNFILDLVEIPFPTPVASRAPLGSLVYSTTANGFINPKGDTDGFTAIVDPRQTITLNVIPTAPATLQPTVDLYVERPDGKRELLASAAAKAAGQEAVLQTIATADTPTPLRYAAIVAGADGTTGRFQIRLTLNAALDAERHGGPHNETLATAQDLDPAFQSVLRTRNAPSRAAVLGTADFSAGLLPDEIEPNNTLETANIASANFTKFSGNLYHMGIKGDINPSGDNDWVNIGTLHVGDVITISMAGAGSRRGTNGDTFVHLYRGPAENPIQVAFDDDGGVPLDSLIHRFNVTTTDTYYIRARHFSSGTGTYDLGILLESAGEPPLTGGTQTEEEEPNDSALEANDFTDAWRPVQYLSRTRATINPVGDTDFYQFQFTAGDLVTININSTSTFGAQVNFLNASGALLARENGTSRGPGRDSPLYAYIIPSTGAYYVQVLGRPGSTGTYNADVYLSTNTPPPPPTFTYDYYSFSLTAGESATLAVKGLGGTSVNLELLDSSDKVLAAGRTGPTNVDQVISNFVAAETGRYYARIQGRFNLDYNLLVSKDTDFDTDPNHDFATAQELASSPVAGRQYALGYVTPQASGQDFYRIRAAEEQILRLETFTPGDLGGAFANVLHPLLRLYDAGGKLVAEDENSADDGHNARLSYTVPTGGGGTYYIEIRPAADTPPTSGEYVLEVQGAGGGVFASRSDGLPRVVPFIQQDRASTALGTPFSRFADDPRLTMTGVSPMHAVPALPYASSVERLFASSEETMSLLSGEEKLRDELQVEWWELA
jgi:hypothetical protein